MMKRIVAFLTCISLVRSLTSDSCPYAEDIKPCSCTLGESREPYVSCNKLKSAEQLVKAVTKMNDYHIDYFTLGQSNIGVIPSDVFRKMEIEHLVIDRCNLTKLSDNRSRPPFIGLENSLRLIEIKRSFQDKSMPLASLSFSHLKKLESIILEGNSMTTIGNNWFENGPYDVKILRISNTNISVIGSHAFEALEKLKYFSLAYSSVPEMTREMLPLPAEFLVTIILNNNKLKSLPSNFFVKMPALREVYLVNNLFTLIDEATWAPIWGQLQNAYFHGNPIVCDKELKWIYNYRLPEFYSGKCASPLNLKNRFLRDITAADLL